MSNNLITRIPSNLGENMVLSNLKNLNLAFNQIDQIEGAVFFNLVSLESLDVRFNKLIILPKEITAARNLKHLFLTGNLLTELPCFLKDMNLKEVQHEWVALCNPEVNSKIFSRLNVSRRIRSSMLETFNFQFANSYSTDDSSS